jgi:hypothetical protein
MLLSRKHLALAALPLAALCSCAAILDGHHDDVTIRSVPAGQSIQVDGKSYTTPVTVELDTREHHTVTGPRGETYPIYGRPNRLAVMEALLILPIIPDLLASAYTTLEPAVITLSSESAPVAAPDPHE